MDLHLLGWAVGLVALGEGAVALAAALSLLLLAASCLNSLLPILHSSHLNESIEYRVPISAVVLSSESSRPDLQS
jgi:hypothetical protein